MHSQAQRALFSTLTTYSSCANVQVTLSDIIKYKKDKSKKDRQREKDHLWSALTRREISDSVSLTQKRSDGMASSLMDWLAATPLFQCTWGLEGSGYFSCLNYLTVVDIYRAGPCMKCHHSLLILDTHCCCCSAGGCRGHTGSINTTEGSESWYASVDRSWTRLRVRDLLHVGSLQSRTALFFHPLGSFSICSSQE